MGVSEYLEKIERAFLLQQICFEEVALKLRQIQMTQLIDLGGVILHLKESLKTVFDQLVAYIISMNQRISNLQMNNDPRIIYIQKKLEESIYQDQTPQISKCLCGKKESLISPLPEENLSEFVDLGADEEIEDRKIKEQEDFELRVANHIERLQVSDCRDFESENDPRVILAVNKKVYKQMIDQSRSNIIVFQNKIVELQNISSYKFYSPEIMYKLSEEIVERAKKVTIESLIHQVETKESIESAIDLLSDSLMKSFKLKMKYIASRVLAYMNRIKRNTEDKSESAELNLDDRSFLRSIGIFDIHDQYEEDLKKTVKKYKKDIGDKIDQIRALQEERLSLIEQNRNLLAKLSSLEKERKFLDGSNNQNLERIYKDEEKAKSHVDELQLRILELEKINKTQTKHIFELKSDHSRVQSKYNDAMSLMAIQKSETNVRFPLSNETSKEDETPSNEATVKDSSLIQNSLRTIIKPGIKKDKIIQKVIVNNTPNTAFLLKSREAKPDTQMQSNSESDRFDILNNMNNGSETKENINLGSIGSIKERSSDQSKDDNFLYIEDTPVNPKLAQFDTELLKVFHKIEEPLRAEVIKMIETFTEIEPGHFKLDFTGDKITLKRKHPNKSERLILTEPKKRQLNPISKIDKSTQTFAKKKIVNLNSQSDNIIGTLKTDTPQSESKSAQKSGQRIYIASYTDGEEVVQEIPLRADELRFIQNMKKYGLEEDLMRMTDYGKHLPEEQPGPSLIEIPLSSRSNDRRPRRPLPNESKSSWRYMKRIRKTQEEFDLPRIKKYEQNQIYDYISSSTSSIVNKTSSFKLRTQEHIKSTVLKSSIMNTRRATAKAALKSVILKKKLLIAQLSKINSGSDITAKISLKNKENLADKVYFELLFNLWIQAKNMSKLTINEPKMKDEFRAQIERFLDSDEDEFGFFCRMGFDAHNVNNYYNCGA